MHQNPGLLGEFSIPACNPEYHLSKVLYKYIIDAGAKSAQQLYEKELNARKIITFCGDLDGMLGGGVATGQITEFCKSRCSFQALFASLLCPAVSQFDLAAQVGYQL